MWRKGIGRALNEEYIYDAKGRLDNAGFLDYRVPVASDMPMIEPILVEVPNPAYPYGAKEVGEVNSAGEGGPARKGLVGEGLLPRDLPLGSDQ